MRQRLILISRIWVFVAAMVFVLSMGLYVNKVDSAAEDSSAATGGTVPGGGACIPNDGIVECMSGFCCECGAYENGATIGNLCLDTAVKPNCTAYCVELYNQSATNSVACGTKVCSAALGGCCTSNNKICANDTQCGNPSSSECPFTDRECTKGHLLNSATQCTTASNETYYCCAEGQVMTQAGSSLVCGGGSGSTGGNGSTTPQCASNASCSLAQISGATKCNSGSTTKYCCPTGKVIGSFEGYKVCVDSPTQPSDSGGGSGGDTASGSGGTGDECEEGLIGQGNECSSAAIAYSTTAGVISEYTSAEATLILSNTSSELEVSVEEQVEYRTLSGEECRLGLTNTDKYYSSEDKFKEIIDSVLAEYQEVRFLNGCRGDVNVKPYPDDFTINTSRYLSTYFNECFAFRDDKNVGDPPVKAEVADCVYKVEGVRSNLNGAYNGDIVECTTFGNLNLETQVVIQEVNNISQIETKVNELVVNANLAVPTITTYDPSCNSVKGEVSVSINISKYLSGNEWCDLYRNGNNVGKAIRELSVECKQIGSDSSQSSNTEFKTSDGSSVCTETTLFDTQTGFVEQYLDFIEASFPDANVTYSSCVSRNIYGSLDLYYSKLTGHFKDGKVCYEYTGGVKGSLAVTDVYLYCPTDIQGISTSREVLGVDTGLSLADESVYQASILDIYAYQLDELPDEDEILNQISEYIQSGSKNGLSKPIKDFVETMVENDICYGDLNVDGKVDLKDFARYAKLYDLLNTEDGRLVSLLQFAQNYNDTEASCSYLFSVDPK